MSVKLSILEEVEEVLQEHEVMVEDWDLVLYNDDVNTFDHVIAQLMKYCEHEYIQAGQCANIVHYNGKCQVKRGALEKLEPICTALKDQGLSAVIE